MKSQIERVGGRVGCSSSVGAQHHVAPKVAQSVHGSLPIGSFSQDDACVSLGGGTLSESNARDCKRKSVDSTADCETGSQKRLRCHTTLGPTPSGLFGIDCMPVMVRPVFKGLMPILI
ncbi:hypothetical protein CTI12_AA491360 [Artemisia annua]|uniref:Uncharacterized protein n=1 Tax=Artemisia annua TaxID=35608 RepID=A0A2U1LHB9_ARTAN|nr:hypothetical protein CTI12_AA491360 [Artemisia annua]